MNQQSLPTFSTDLIDELDESIPSGVPDLSTPDRAVWWNAAQRELVESLKQRKEEGVESEFNTENSTVHV